MDLDELNGPTRPQPRKGKFLPKASKIKSEPKPEPESKPLLIITTDVSDAVEMDIDPKAVDDVVKESAVVEEEEEDCVVREIDVYFNPLVDSDTQYPLRPCWRPYELEERCEEVRFKPTTSEVEVDLSIDIDSKNYDANGYHQMTTTKQTFSTSMKPIGGAKGMAVGMLTGNKLHINPIRAAVQLRPSRKLDVSIIPSNKKDAVKSEDLKDEKSSGPSKKQPPGRPNRADDKVDEDWIALNHHSANSEFSARYLEKMAGTEGSPIQFSMSLNNYINAICPGANSDNNKTKGLVARALHSLPLEERFRTWLREHPCPNRFATLKHLAPEDSIEDVFVALQIVACLVQGLWVPKSAVLLKTDLEALAWDYVLLLFSKSPTICYYHVKSLRPRERKAITEVLSTLANDRLTLKDWKFKVAPDMTFVKLYPKIVIEQELNWKRAGELITKGFKETERAVKPDVATKQGTQKASSSNVAVRSSNGVVSKTPMSNETREALPKALLKVFQTHKVCSFQQICIRLREMAVSESARPKGVPREARAAADAVDSPQEELMKIINQVATNIHGVYVLKKSQDDQQFDPLRKVVIDLLLAEGPNAKLKKANILAAAKVELKRDIPDSEYNKVLKELCVTQGAAWVLKRGDGNPSSK